jgi:hypothetical protein
MNNENKLISMSDKLRNDIFDIIKVFIKSNKINEDKDIVAIVLNTISNLSSDFILASFNNMTPLSEYYSLIHQLTVNISKKVEGIYFEEKRGKH